MPLSRDEVAETINALPDPITGKPLGETKMVKEVSVDGHTVRATIELTSPASASKEAIEKAAREALTARGVSTLDLSFTANVRTRQITGEDPCPDVKNVVLVMAGK